MLMRVQGPVGQPVHWNVNISVPLEQEGESDLSRRKSETGPDRRLIYIGNVHRPGIDPLGGMHIYGTASLHPGFFA